jgi:hypothetical protein
MKSGVALDFYTVVEAARRRGEVAVGYRVKAEAGGPRKSYGVCLNRPSPGESSSRKGTG